MTLEMSLKTHLSKDKSKLYWYKKFYEYKALSIPLMIQTALSYLMFDANERMDDRDNFHLLIANGWGPFRDTVNGMMIMGFLWLFREYRWVIFCQSNEINGYSPQSSFVKRSQSSKISPKISDLENQLSKVTAEKRSIIKSMMVLIESMRSILDESKNLRIPITIPINDFRNETMILPNMKKLKQNLKKVCELLIDNENSKNIKNETHLLKEANQNLKKELSNLKKTSQKEIKIAQKELKLNQQKSQTEINAHKQQNFYMENELKALKKKNEELSEQIMTSTRTIEDLTCEKQQSSGRITSFGARITNLEKENVELKSKLKRAQLIITKESQIDVLENANKTLELENSRLREENECSICCEEVNRTSNIKWEAFVPCGHRFCSKCARNICSGQNGHNQRVCPNCRTDIERILPVYHT